MSCAVIPSIYVMVENKKTRVGKHKSGLIIDCNAPYYVYIKALQPYVTRMTFFVTYQVRPARRIIIFAYSSVILTDSALPERLFKYIKQMRETVPATFTK